jgi:hypothetical protein
MTEQELTSGLPATVVVSRSELPKSPSESIATSQTVAEDASILKVVQNIRSNRSRSKLNKSKILKVDIPVTRSGCFPFRAVRYDEQVPDMLKLGRIVEDKVYLDVVAGLNKHIDRTSHKLNVIRVMISAFYLLILAIVSLASRNASYTAQLTLPWFVLVLFIQEFSFYWIARRSVVSYIKELNAILDKKNLVLKLRRSGVCGTAWEGVTLGVIVNEEQLNVESA